MDTKYEVIITNKAKRDLKEIYNYISKSLMAKSCSIIEYYKKRKYPYRKLLIKNYVAIYRVDYKNKLVYISRVVYGGRNYLNEI